MVESVHLCCGYVLTTNNLQLGLQFMICNYFMQQFSLQVAAVPIPSCVPREMRCSPAGPVRTAAFRQHPGEGRTPTAGVKALLAAEL